MHLLAAYPRTLLPDESLGSVDCYRPMFPTVQQWQDGEVEAKAHYLHARPLALVPS